MKQTTHTWIAIRALELIGQDRKTKGLAELLTPWVKYSYVGCWLPDMSQFRKGHGVVNNHTFKMAPFAGDHKDRFVISKDKLTAKIDSNIELHSLG